MDNQEQSWGGEEGLPQEVRGAAEGCRGMKSGCPKVGGTGNGVHSLSKTDMAPAFIFIHPNPQPLQHPKKAT